ncbi:MAG: group III truncated hemoglobin [Proteobacteria bacterium]|nr:group III truncated hemoglobin [Pseudomonadota bacterium]
MSAGATQDAANIDDATIEMLVHTFYSRVRSDELLGPLFDERVPDWDVHVQRMCLFWASVMLLEGRYATQALRRRAPPEFSRPHFSRWLQLFRQSALETCPGPAAELFIARAELIAASVAPARGA